MKNTTCIVTGLCCCAAAVFMGCRTAGRGDTGGKPAVTVPFVPATARASIQWAEGRYPNLFAPSSYAVWPAPAAPSENGSVESLFLDIECHVASEFADSSIAYDLVGLRGVDVYLIAPDGAQVRPIQVQRGPELTEEPRGALRYFARTNHLLFPLRTLDLTMAAGAGASSVRLVLEAHGAVYQFEWPASAAAAAAISPPEQSALESAGAGARKAWNKARDVAHTFD